MTITNTTLASPTYNGNGSTTAFATGFQFISNSDLQVVVTDADGVETIKTLTTHYTVTGAGVAGGGTVTFLTAPASGTFVNIKSNVTLDQQVDYVEGGAFSAATHETALDKLTKAVQQIKEITDRSLKLPISNQSITTQTSPITAGYILGVNDAGTALEWKTPEDVASGATISTFGASLVDDADAAAARKTLGLGTLATQSGTVSGTNTGDQNLFSTIAVSGQSDVVADSATDTLTLVAGTNVTITTDAATDSITINASVGGGTTAVNAGGTGVTSLTAYAPIFGGTTSTGAVQSGTVGTAGQLLTSNGAGALPTFQTFAGSSGQLVLISSTTASASATIDFTGLTSTYQAYMVVISDLVTATDGVSLLVRFGTGGGPTYDTGSNYRYTTQGAYVTGSDNNASASATSIALNIDAAGGTLGNVGGENYSGTITLYNPSNSTSWKKLSAQSAYDGSGSEPAVAHTAGGYMSTTAVTAIRFFASSGNLTSGRFTLFGIKHT
jgi:hypothetical protein